jgi:hypothetical protein
LPSASASSPLFRPMSATRENRRPGRRAPHAAGSSDRVQAELLDERHRVDDVAERLRDLLPLVGPPAMREDAPRRLEPGGHQEGRPVDRVEAQDVLADEVDVGRPPLRESIGIIRIARRGDVVGQRVQPDIHHMRRVARHGHAPAEGGAADRKVAEAPTSRRQRLRSAGWRAG